MEQQETKFEVPVKVSFDCKIIIKAETRLKAQTIIEENFWLKSVSSFKGYHPSIVDWITPVNHSKIEIGQIKLSEH